MGFSGAFDTQAWARMPFHFWTVTFFVLGTVVGSFLNVCIHRVPLGQSIVSPPSHCPHCQYSIPWFLNLPLATWLYLQGKCANCRAPIAIRYFLVELLTGVLFLGCWLRFGHESAAVAAIMCVVVAGLVVATFIDLEHYIIPDGLNYGGMVAGVLAAFFVPRLFGETNLARSLQQSLLGLGVGAGIIYTVLRLGKLAFGQEKIALEPGTRIIFGDTGLILPDREIPYEEVFYRESDTIVVAADRAELFDRGFCGPVTIRLSPNRLRIDDEEFDPEQVPWLEVSAAQLSLPREAMGLGDVKFMAAIGAFLGWPGVVFSLLASSCIGSVFGVILLARQRQGRSSTVVPYGPYIAAAALLWIFESPAITRFAHAWMGW